MSEAALRSAVRLWRSDSAVETYLAVALVAVVLGPVVWKYYSDTSGRVSR